MRGKCWNGKYPGGICPITVILIIVNVCEANVLLLLGGIDQGNMSIYPGHIRPGVRW